MTTTELAKLRAVLLTVIDDGCDCDPKKHQWQLNHVDESFADEQRLRFRDRVIAAMEKGNDG